MNIYATICRFFSSLLSVSILLSLCACSSASDTVVDSATVSSTVSATEEIPLSISHPFIYSDATWTSTPADIETLMKKSPDKTSFAGDCKKSYVFYNTEYNSIAGKCAFIFKDELLCKTNFVYDSSQPFDDISSDFIAELKEVYGDPTADKSESSGDNTNIWLEWSADDYKISYFYSFTDNKYNLVLAYELPADKIPATDASDRNGDFRIGFWGDDEDTVNKFETAKFEGLSTDGLTMLYSGSVAGNDTYIMYDFDSAGKLYRGIYNLTTTYSNASFYITSYETLKDSLTEKYGKPSSDKIKKISSLAQYADADVALQLGYSVYQTVWNTETTEVSLGMLNDGSGISIVISYTDPNHEEVKNTSGL